MQKNKTCFNTAQFTGKSGEPLCLTQSRGSGFHMLFIWTSLSSNKLFRSDAQLEWCNMSRKRQSLYCIRIYVFVTWGFNYCLLTSYSHLYHCTPLPVTLHSLILFTVVDQWPEFAAGSQCTIKVEVGVTVQTWTVSSGNTLGLEKRAGCKSSRLSGD